MGTTCPDSETDMTHHFFWLIIPREEKNYQMENSERNTCFYSGVSLESVNSVSKKI